MLKITTTIGLEEVSKKEVERLINKKCEIKRGFLLCEGGEREREHLIVNARTINSAGIVAAKTNIKTLKELEEEIEKCDWHFLEGRSFGVESSRNGVHPFNSMDISRTIGSVIMKSCKNARVHLKNPDIKIKAHLNGEELLVWLEKNAVALHKRGYRAYKHPAALKSTVAAAMLMWCEWKGECLYDPMCGGGTLLCEAHLYASGIAPSLWRPKKDISAIPTAKPLFKTEIKGGDKSMKHVKGAIRNAVSCGMVPEIRKNDATKQLEESELVITNPPYGIRIANKERIKTLYKAFAQKLKETKTEKVCVLTAEGKIMKKEMEKNGYQIVKKKKIVNGNLLTDLLLFKH